jgi:hypothetical protein
MNDLTIVICSKRDLTGLNRTLNSVNLKELTTTKKIIVLSDYPEIEIDQMKSKFNEPSFEFLTSDAKGIYNAQNFGLSQVKTTFVQFLNGGDELVDVSGLKLLVAKLEGSLWGYGSLRITKLSGKTYNYSFHYMKLLHRLGLKYIPHPSSVINTKAILELGGYDENYQSAADHKLFLLLSRQCKPIVISDCISNFYLGGASTRSNELIVNDSANISREIFGNYFKSSRLDRMVWKTVMGLRNTRNLFRHASQM